MRWRVLITALTLLAASRAGHATPTKGAPLGQRLLRAISKPIPLGRRVVVNLAPKLTPADVKPGERKVAIGAFPRVHVPNALALGIVSYSTEESSPAIGAAVGVNRCGPAGGGIAGIGGTHGAGGILGWGFYGDAFSVLAAVAGRRAWALIPFSGKDDGRARDLGL